MRRLLLTVPLALAAPAHADDGRAGGKLLLTGGVSTVEGSAGGGIATWAVVAGNETRNGIGGAAHATVIALPDFTLTSQGVAIGLWDRVELSYARQRFDTRDAGAALGLGRGFTFGQDVFGTKLRVAGDAVWDQDRWLPQIAVGVQHRRATKGTIVRAVGARSDKGTDFYVSATKVLLARSLVVGTTARWTAANQWGLLGYGGDKGGRSLQVEGSAGLMLSRRLVVGGEFRSKPDNLAFAREGDAWDAFAAWAVHRNVTLTAAYADLGPIATVKGQRGLFGSLQFGF